MNKTINELKLALDMPFETFAQKGRFRDEISCILIEALEQPAQEPVGVVSWHEGTVMGSIFPSSNMPKDGDKLYTHPKEWRGLTDEERNKIWSNIEAEENTEMYFGGKLALAIEAKLKEKNT